jgi:nicotinamide mononucleotide (NMN) deamidase PncC
LSARRLLRADYALAVTGIAEPRGGTPDKPVGTAYIALSENQRTNVRFQYSPADRETFKFAISQRAGSAAPGDARHAAGHEANPLSSITKFIIALPLA